ncbi:MAG TPA: hypothetical protein VFL96_01290, partial [Acidobacteriaceae bacterium]|nr:hypothetical protein [Acidobacteriaceae bacterium]
KTCAGRGGGRVTPQQIEQHRRECEALHVLAMPYHERKPWLNAIGKRRGLAAQQYLEAEVRRQHQLKREAA